MFEVYAPITRIQVKSVVLVSFSSAMGDAVVLAEIDWVIMSKVRVAYREDDELTSKLASLHVVPNP